jgi:hypothetical protein
VSESSSTASPRTGCVSNPPGLSRAQDETERLRPGRLFGQQSFHLQKNNKNLSIASRRKEAGDNNGVRGNRTRCFLYPLWILILTTLLPPRCLFLRCCSFRSQLFEVSFSKSRTLHLIVSTGFDSTVNVGINFGYRLDW